MTAHYSAGEPVFGQCLSPGDGLTSLSSIFGAAEGRRVKFKKSVGKTQFAMKCLVLHTLLSFLPVNFMLFLIALVLFLLDIEATPPPDFFLPSFLSSIVSLHCYYCPCCVWLLCGKFKCFFLKLPRLSLKAADKNSL